LGIIATQIDLIKKSNPLAFELFEVDRNCWIDELFKTPISFSKNVTLFRIQKPEQYLVDH